MKPPLDAKPTQAKSAPAGLSYQSQNDVFLRGVLADVPLERVLPSGDELCAFRLTVPRPPRSRVRVDSIDCATTRAAVRRRVMNCPPGQILEVSGNLHRRFWRGPAGLASRYEVEVTALKVIRVTGRQSGG
jgi:single-strand DNA-binding protein